MEHGEIPRDWKRANVCLIYKKGAKNKAENYSPISLDITCLQADGEFCETGNDETHSRTTISFTKTVGVY